jgi:pimeloyl-ACP methyl ester carboxylesterase
MQTLSVYSRIMLVGTAAVLASSAGCSQMDTSRAERMPRGYIYYCDGAGGGGLISNWAGGLRSGLVDAGYAGAGEIFRWNTGLGVVADQTASVEYKKDKAAQLAREIIDYQGQYAGAPVHLMGLSAGTAVVAYTLEALPAANSVDNVVMLSGSLSSRHDLTSALRRVKGKMYIFTSQRDEVLLSLVPYAGTADREDASGGTIGLNGARLPAGATSETRNLYRKIVVIPWNQQFERYGDYGGHTDVVAAPFVQQFIAPLVMARPTRSSTAVASAGRGHIENPDYARWANFDVGSWVLFEGSQQSGGTRQPIRIRATLVRKDQDRLLIQREAEGGEVADQLTRSFYVTRHIDPSKHPLTHTRARKQQLADETLDVGSHKLACKSQSVATNGTFEVWGSNISATVASSPEIPGGIVRLHLKTTLDGKPVELTGQAVDYGVVSSTR